MVKPLVNKYLIWFKITPNFGLNEDIVERELLGNVLTENFEPLLEPTETHRLNSLKEAWDRSIIFTEGYL